MKHLKRNKLANQIKHFDQAIKNAEYNKNYELEKLNETLKRYAKIENQYIKKYGDKATTEINNSGTEFSHNVPLVSDFDIADIRWDLNWHIDKYEKEVNAIEILTQIINQLQGYNKKLFNGDIKSDDTLTNIYRFKDDTTTKIVERARGVINTEVKIKL